MKSEPVIRLSGVGKQYVKYDDVPTLLSHALHFQRRTRRSQLWAIRGVDLEVGQGESLGVIGRNGSGKSTLLRLLAGVTAPSEGTVEVAGWVAPLISLGVGFHPELTGRENVYVNGAVLGLSRRQVDERIEEVFAFSELSAFADTPVKFYSSGMFVRLGFAASVMAQPDVLLVDEVLSVGDLAFQSKCFERMLALRDAGTTIVVVSHNLSAVRSLCPRTIVIHDGACRYDGDTAGALARYYSLIGDPLPVGPDGRPVDLPANLPVVVEEVSVEGRGSPEDIHRRSGDEVALRLRFRCAQSVEKLVFEVGIFHEGGVRVYGETLSAGDRGPFAADEQGHLDARMRLHLATGSYAVCFWVRSPAGELLAAPPRPAVFVVDGSERVTGLVDLESSLVLHRPGGDANGQQ